ncbi:ATP-binding cassette domain-containing protein [Desulfogranum japonicum]|uniref:ATP-binding cassette domain-containing protein n=1 Tax=Desulfogranum japonicum TaxID=231447 RepID=UPI000403E58D|nr:ATP-binding cassette domain-containing protein [Desulfogranum japonicum]
MPAENSSKQTVAPLECTGVSKEFTVEARGIKALEQVSFTLKKNMVTGLIGPDGAGKTTLMRLCMGLLKTSAGSLSVLGFDPLRDRNTVLAKVGYMPQRFGLYQDLTVQENMDLYADLQGVALQQRGERYAQLLDMSGLTPFTRRLAGNLSGGMKQKLGLVCTMIRPPQLLLLDEPTVGVDPVSRRELWNIVYHLVEEEGMAVMLSTAYLDEAERCREVILLHQGKVIGQGTPSSFSNQVQGRTFQVQAEGEHKRVMQKKLARMNQVQDALILGKSLRVVTEKGQTLDSKDFPGHDVQVHAVPPRFEDYFVATLKTKHQKGGQAITLHTAIQESDSAVIQVQDLVRTFGSFTAVDHVSFHVNTGEIFGLLGANGAGKTTTFRMLCGLLPISSGSCRVAGMDLRTASAQARSRIGYMAQKFSLYGNLTVGQNLKFFASAYGLRGKHQKRQMQWAISTFDLDQYLKTESGMLPLGYKQRLALAVALMHEPDVLFLDEPTSGVDPLARREFWTHINSLAEQGVTVLVTTHFMEEAEYCDRLVIMAEGNLLAQGTPEEIKADNSDREGATMEDAFIHLLEHNGAAQ